jgi:restriction system protein
MPVWCQECKRLSFDNDICTECGTKIIKKKNKKIHYKKEKKYNDNNKKPRITNKKEKKVTNILKQINEYIDKLIMNILKIINENTNKNNQKIKQSHYTHKQPKKQKTTHKEKIQKGAEYEKFVARVYRSRGYNVTEHGREMGKKDHGIDLIAKKDKEIIFIQCKTWNENGKWKIRHDNIKSFQTDARTFVEQKPIFKNYKLQIRYTLSGDFIHVSAIRHIEEMQKRGKKIDYEILPMI